MKKHIVFYFLISLFVCELVAQNDLDSGLMYYYSFDGTISDNQNNSQPQINGTIGLTTDCQSTTQSACSLSGANSFIELDNTENFNPTGDFCMSLWVKIPTTQQVTTSSVNSIISKWILSNGDHNNAGYPFVLRVFNQTDSRNGQLVFSVFDGLSSACRNSSSITSFNRYNDNEFHHLLVGRQNGLLQLFIDCELIGSIMDQSDCSVGNNAKIFLGARNETFSFFRPNNFNGAIDEFRIYNRFLNNDERISVSSCLNPDDTLTCVTCNTCNPPCNSDNGTLVPTGN